MNKNIMKKYNKWIAFFSITIPIIVIILFNIRLPNVKPLTFLPPIYASINATTAIILIVAFFAIKNKKIMLHERLMKLAISFSVLFLLMYVAYHMTSNPTHFGGKGFIKYFYYFILITHVLLSIIIIPFVLITFVRALGGDFFNHKKIARITFPLWLYVAISGVVVYVLISPYY